MINNEVCDLMRKKEIYNAKEFWEKPEDALISVNEICQIFNCHYNSLYKWKVAGKIAPITRGPNGRSLRYRKGDILKFFGYQKNDKVD